MLPADVRREPQRRSRANPEQTRKLSRFLFPALGLPALAMIAGLAGCGDRERAGAPPPPAQPVAQAAAASPAGELAGYEAPLSPGATPVRGDPHRLEAGFVSGGAFSAPAAERAAQTQERFDRLLTALDEGFRNDPDAGEIARLFGTRITGALAQSGTGVALERLACGQRICAASLTGDKIPASRLLEALMSGNGDGGAKIGASSIKLVEPSAPGAPAGYRVVFSTDPSVSVIVERP
ncbi:hypothetical protein A7A76_04790 [Lysobacter enzymogenes]|uniref:hypothetical protein n=1 Tax=Lysobacter enzymogenes TaxID=69 RepID=UPI0019D17527|nr:hypothetical protein [Lysobacter enzymogenes]MBN7138423.1 hypothetical protein [Lysobacter enzymogenes]